MKIGKRVRIAGDPDNETLYVVSDEFIEAGKNCVNVTRAKDKFTERVENLEIIPVVGASAPDMINHPLLYTPIRTAPASIATRTEIDLYCCPCCGAAPIVEASVINDDSGICLSHDVSCNPCGLSAPLGAWTAIGRRLQGLADRRKG